ncbi:MAG: glutamate mutase L [Bacillota bacterium]
MSSWLIIDCASKTTAVLVQEIDGRVSLLARGEARTTLDPEGDVTLGVLQAVAQVEEASGWVLRSTRPSSGLICPVDEDGNGVDQVLVTSSVGGGLQMMVAGLVRIMTADSAERAALGAGANVLDVISIDDGRMPYERIQRMRELKPDMFLFGGGVDQGNVSDVLEFAQEIQQAGLSFMPIVYAGNTYARTAVSEILGTDYELHMVENMRPVLEEEVLEPTRQRIHQLYMRHVVSKGPGFARLASWASRPIMPSTGAISRLAQTVAAQEAIDLLAVHVGSSTTDVFSVFDGRFTRTVSADLGLGYSIANVAVKAGSHNLLRWLPGNQSHHQLMDYLRNKMLSPVSEPTEQLDGLTQQAAAREAMRLALQEHRQRATSLRGVRRQRDVSAIFNQVGSDVSIVDMLRLQLIIASASVFAWTDDQTSVRILLDGLLPQGITTLAIDQQATSPHFGVLASVAPEIGHRAFMHHGLRYLGVAVCPVGAVDKAGTCLSLIATGVDGQEEVREFGSEQLAFIPLRAGERAVLQPHVSLDIGAGRGRRQTVLMIESSCGLIIDTRKRVRA